MRKEVEGGPRPKSLKGTSPAPLSSRSLRVVVVVHLAGAPNSLTALLSSSPPTLLAVVSRFPPFWLPLEQGLPWSKDEDTLLLSLYESTGPRWQLIARSIPGRTGLCCRNRWRKFKGDELVASELAALEEKQKKTVGGNAGGTRTLADGGRGRRSNSTPEEGSAGSSTGSGTKAGEKKRKRVAKDEDDESTSPVDDRRPPQPAGSSSLSQQIQLASANLQHQHQQQQQMDPNYRRSSQPGQYDFFDSLHQNPSPNSQSDTSSSSSYDQAHLQTFSHHGEALVAPFGLSLFSPNSHLQTDKAVQSPLSHHSPHNPHPHESTSPLGGIGGVGLQPLRDGGGMLYSPAGAPEHAQSRTLTADGAHGDGQNGTTNGRVEDSIRAGLRGLPAFDNQLDRFAHLLPPDHHLQKSQQSTASTMSSSSMYTPSMSGTSPSTTLDSLATPASDTNNSGPVLAPTPQVSSSDHLDPPSSSLAIHHDDSSWMASFLGSLHHPSASLPPSALNSPLFTGAFEAGLFSAPPSPTRHLYQHLLPPPPLNLDALTPLVEERSTTPSSTTPSYRPPSAMNNASSGPSTTKTSASSSYLPPPQSTAQLSNANHLFGPSPADRNLQQQRERDQHQQQLLQNRQAQQQQNASLYRSSPPPRNMRNDAFPLPTTATSGHTPTGASTASGGGGGYPHSVYPMPQTILPYMTWDPRPVEEQSPPAPMVLVPAVVLAGLLERAGMQHHRS